MYINHLACTQSKLEQDFFMRHEGVKFLNYECISSEEISDDAEETTESFIVSRRDSEYDSDPHLPFMQIFKKIRDETSPEMRFGKVLIDC